MFYCAFCKEEFISYKATAPAECPRCGRPAKGRPHGRYTGLVAIIILAGIVIVALLAYAVLR
jgi:DNA-directed RNA polymerase subunit RPC12/RpoP